MSDQSQGPGWWQASDLKWYPPESLPGTSSAPPAATPPTAYGPAGYRQPGYDAPPGYGPPGYGPPGYGYGYAPSPYGTPSGLPSVSGQAVASMILGIIAVIPCFWPYSCVLALVGLPLGIVALNRIRNGQADPASRGQALGGVIMNAISLTIAVLFIVLMIGLIASSPS